MYYCFFFFRKVMKGEMDTLEKTSLCREVDILYFVQSKKLKNYSSTTFAPCSCTEYLAKWFHLSCFF